MGGVVGVSPFFSYQISYKTSQSLVSKICLNRWDAACSYVFASANTQTKIFLQTQCLNLTTVLLF